VLTLHECRSVTIIQRQFCTKFGKEPPSDNSIRMWYAQFHETKCVCKRKSNVRPSVTEQQVEQVRQAFVQSPRKPTVRGSIELGIPQPTVAHFTEGAKTETILPNAATKITTQRLPSKDDFLH
jgi:hypothetical protein